MDESPAILVAGQANAAGNQSVALPQVFHIAPSVCKIKLSSLVSGGKSGLPASASQPPSKKEIFLAMAIPATQLRPGMIIKHNNDLHSVFSVEHRTPGNLRAFIQAKLRNLRTGAMFEHRFRSPDPIEKINVDEQEMEYLYADGDSYYFMDTTNFEQTHLTKEILGDAVDYLTPNLQIQVEFFDGKAVGIELPQTVILTVVETEPGLKSATASSVTKAAKTETGLVVQVPPFINEGEKIKVDTAEGVYLSRAQ
jgi:elongation factor P